MEKIIRHDLPVIIKDNRHILDTQNIFLGTIKTVEVQLFLLDDNTLRLKVTPVVNDSGSYKFINHLNFRVNLGKYEYINNTHILFSDREKMKQSKRSLTDLTWFNYYKNYFDDTRKLTKIYNQKTRKYINAKHQSNLAVYINDNGQKRLDYCAGGLTLDNENRFVVTLGIGEILFNFTMKNLPKDNQIKRYKIKDSDYKPMMREVVKIK